MKTEFKAIRDPHWYKDAVIYELHVKSFCDSNGDGIGDFPGLTGKLPYLQSLGVTALAILFYVGCVAAEQVGLLAPAGLLRPSPLPGRFQALRKISVSPPW